MAECTAAIIVVVLLTDVNSQLSPGLSSRQTSISRLQAARTVTVWRAENDVTHHTYTDPGSVVDLFCCHAIFNQSCIFLIFRQEGRRRNFIRGCNACCGYKLPCFCFILSARAKSSQCISLSSITELFQILFLDPVCTCAKCFMTFFFFCSKLTELSPVNC